MENKVKLFQTAKKICDRGDIKLSATDKKRIEDETKDLLKKSTGYRSASKSDRFLKTIADLSEANNAVDYLKIAAKYLKAEDVIEGDVAEILEQVEEAVEEVGDLIEQAEEAVEGEDPEDKKTDKDKDEMNLYDKKTDDYYDMKDGDKDKKEDKKEDKKPDFLNPDTIDKAKEAVIKLSRGYEMGMGDTGPMMDSPMDNGPEDKGPLDMKKMKDKKKGPGLGKPNKMKDLQDKKEIEEEVTIDEMGIDKEAKRNSFKKFKVSITPDKNIVASHVDKGPLFLAVTEDHIKADDTALRRAGNKILGLLIYEGPKVAAAKCGTKLIAQSDENIETDTVVDVEPNKGGVTEGAETDTREGEPGDPNSALDDNEVDTEEKPDKVTAIKKRLKAKLQKKSENTVLDDAENDSVEDGTVNPNTLDSTADDETDTKESRPAEPNNALEDAETDTKEAESHYKKLYANRAKKTAEEQTKQFVGAFERCMRIASKRMLLNHDNNPLKAASMDVLTADDVVFSDGAPYRQMDALTAKELTELISTEGYDEFVTHLISKTVELMEKSSEYLDDLESDIDNLAPVDVPVEESAPRMNARSRQLRQAASEGNFHVNANIPDSVNQPSSNPLRDAIGSTKVSSRSARLLGLGR